MKHLILGLGLSAVVGVANAASCDMKNPVEIPVTIPAGTEPVVLEVHLGPLPGRALVRLETVDGVTVGSLGVFGVIGVAPAGFPQMAVDPQPNLTGDLCVTGIIILNGAERPATPDELRGIQVVSP